MSSLAANRRPVAILFLIVFIDLVGFGLLIPVIPLYAKFFGANEFTGSLLIATYSLLQFIAAPVLGRLSDERGRKPILMLSLIGATVAWVLFGLAEAIAGAVGTATGLGVLFVARGVAGAMGGNIAAANAYIADITGPEERAKGLGILGAAFGVGFVFGPAIAAIVTQPVVLQALGAVSPAWIPISPYSVPSFIAAGLSFTALVLTAIALPEPSRTTAVAPSGRGRVARLRAALGTPGLFALIIAFFVVSFAFSAFESQFIFLTNDRLGYGTVANGVLLTYIGVLIVIVQGGLIGPLTRRFGEARLAVSGVVIQLATLWMVPFAVGVRRLPSVGLLDSGGVALALIATPLAFGNGITNVSLNALVSRTAGADEQGGIFGLTQSAGSLARTVGPATAGLLYVTAGYWSPFVVSALLFAPVVVLLLRSAALSGEH
jgi:Arabinose efflux permease